MNQAPPRRTQVYLLMLLFFGPLLAAGLLYFVFPQWLPQARTNYGELIDPARPAPADLKLVGVDGTQVGVDALRTRWTYLYLGADQCDRACADKLYQFRQIRTRLNDKQSRVQRVYLAPDASALVALQQQLGAQHPDLKFYAAADGSPRLADFLHAAGTAAGAPQVIYLFDPHGNWLMDYPADAESSGVFGDIKMLLANSQIDG
ncbi:hypothetical protein [Solimonas terrae]|uniref:Thioredoxin domain-containing protein n=1 Tax=Solimonas terrae TaxID=1396819 RepID=A0A6M2BRG3_9GAMM|nr:hypothetical protein [Solimonas terrae]NGY05078.1 hypothetical protein [Solimonas terrae]